MTTYCVEIRKAHSMRALSCVSRHMASQAGEVLLRIARAAALGDDYAASERLVFVRVI